MCGLDELYVDPHTFVDVDSFAEAVQLPKCLLVTADMERTGGSTSRRSSPRLDELNDLLELAVGCEESMVVIEVCRVTERRRGEEECFRSNAGVTPAGPSASFKARPEVVEDLRLTHRSKEIADRIGELRLHCNRPQLSHLDRERFLI